MAGVTVITPHSLRRSGASWLIAEGEDVKRVSQRLRHTSVAVTLDLYVTLQESAQRDVSERLDASLERRRRAAETD